MSRFPVARAKSSYKPVDGDLMFLTSYDKIDPNEPNARNFHDVIGIITEISAIKPVGNARIPSSYNRHVLIKNLSDGILKITLWGKRAQEFYLTNTYDPQKQTPVIVLFVGCLPKEFQGEVLLSGGAAYHWYFNPSIEEATAFYNNLDGQEITPPQLPQREHHDLKYIIPLNPHDVPDEGYECTVTITSIPEGKTWYYIACNTCPNKPSIDPIIRQCSTCGSTKYCFRYKLTFKASDGTAEAEMFAFDTVARTIIGKPCPMVVASFPDASAIPPEITAIVSRKYTFIVVFNNQSYRFLEKALLIKGIVASYGRMTSLPRVQEKLDVHLPPVPIQPKIN
ncbi:hypothetical protein Zm00014a_024781 [Zea mays]|uniref:Replication factor A C-terminal domain-containing protein n=1 Tax=Zea mays TaxID=4577 RepID=A0A3L6FIF5_MAIZE|nr:hypothetical protein Zm00014a_024781 [Zea mays]